jgi:3-phosphoshikimate 1-carboxyvinyltransferase
MDETPIATGASSLTSSVALVAAALADGTSVLLGPCQDPTAESVRKILGALGVVIESHDPGGPIQVHGRRGLWAEQEGHFEGLETSLATRLAVALCAMGQGEFRVDVGEAAGVVDLAPLVNALVDLSAQITFEGQTGRPPVLVRGRGLRGGQIQLQGADTETLAALLVVAPYASRDVLIELSPGGSTADLARVIEVMDAFGVTVLERDMARFIVAAPQRYVGREYAIRG